MEYLLIKFETRNFEFNMIAEMGISEAEINDLLCKKISAHKKAYPDADIKEMKEDIKGGNYSIVPMRFRELYRDGQRM
jgi:hypothetical protein